MRTRAIFVHITQALAEGALIAVLVLGLIAGTAFAARSGNHTTSGSGGSLTLAMVTDVNADGLPNWGDQVKFDVSTTATTTPHVSLQCSQSGVLVYTTETGYYAGYPWPWTQIMT